MKPSFNERLEREAQNGTEWRYGAIAKDLAAVPLKDRIDSLPFGVLQYNDIMDTNGCASRAPLNAVEQKLNWFYEHGMHPAIKKWCDDNGYRVNGKFALCDAFIEILSGTTINGNSLKAPLDAVRKFGVIPAALIPLQNGMTWEQYMDSKRVTEKHKELGRQFLRRIQIQYEQVAYPFLDALNDDGLVVAGHGWSIAVNGVYPRTDDSFNHAFFDVNPEIDAFDSYTPFVKRLAKDYKFFEWGYSISFTNQNPFPDETMRLFEVLKQQGLLAFFAEAFRRLVEVKEVTSPVSVPNPVIPKISDLVALSEKSLGTDISPLDLAPDEVSCAEGLSNLVAKIYPFPSSVLSTAQLKECLDDSIYFKRSITPGKGVIVVSPRTTTVNGHCGIFVSDTEIASNDSRTGLFQKNYTWDTWVSEFKYKRGLRIYLFEAV